MSGAEAALVLGVISSIIAIVDATKKIYDGFQDARGLPEAYRMVADRLPIVHSILEKARKAGFDAESSVTLQAIVRSCEAKVTKLHEIFPSAMPEEGASTARRQIKAVKSYGKSNEVERLMEGILKDVQLLTCERGLDTATQNDQQKITDAISELSRIALQVPANTPTDELSSCMSGLFLTDPLGDRDRLLRQKGAGVEGTCEWIDSNETYLSWSRSQSSLLWVSGGPGKGKTMLSLSFLPTILKERPRPTKTLCFFNTFATTRMKSRGQPQPS